MMQLMHTEEETEEVVSMPGPATGGSQQPAAPAATPPPPPAGAVVVGLLDSLKLEVAPTSAPGGAVTFRAENRGAIVHELAVLKTDTPPDAIPLAAGKADETKVQVVGRTKNLNGKAYEDLRLTLTSGAHVLICNIPGHYQGGMRMAFMVQ
jgi:hypothetical protein